MTYNFHPAARAEYREAAAFYESRRSGLGAAFSIEVEAAISRILQAPNRWLVVATASLEGRHDSSRFKAVRAVRYEMSIVQGLFFKSEAPKERNVYVAPAGA